MAYSTGATDVFINKVSGGLRQRGEGKVVHTWKKVIGGKALREGVLKAEGRGGGTWWDGMGVKYALQRISGLFAHAAHIRRVLKHSYLVAPRTVLAVASRSSRLCLEMVLLLTPSKHCFSQ